MENEKTVTIDYPTPEALKPHEGEWVALDGSKIVASGSSVAEVQRHASEQGHEEVILYLVPSSHGTLAPLTI